MQHQQEVLSEIISTHQDSPREYICERKLIVLRKMAAMVKNATAPRDRTGVAIRASTEIIIRYQQQIVSGHGFTLSELSLMMKLCDMYIAKLIEKEDAILELNGSICQTNIFQNLVFALQTIRSFALIWIQKMLKC